MRKTWILIPIALFVVVSLRDRITLSPPTHTDSKMSAGQVHAIKTVTQSKTEYAEAAEHAPQDSDRVSSNRAHPGTELQERTETAPTNPSPNPSDPAPPPPPPPPKKLTTDSSGPSIGSVKVLGHRGCDSNTQGWFLSVGTPEQYDFTVAEDGESLVVEPNVPNPSGQFEFIHCADPGQFVGKRVRFTARMKAQDIPRVAQIRLRGEDFRRQKILSEVVKANGTYDWKDFSVEAEVGAEVALFSYGVTFNSTGKLWISHPTFEVIP